MLDIPNDSLATLKAALRSARPATSAASAAPADVLLVRGPSASAKSHLLLHFLIDAIFPTHSAAALFDTDLSFDILRFHALLCARLRRLLPHADDRTLDARTQDVLTRLHIFSPTSSAQLATTIYHLPKYLAVRSPNSRIAFVGVDSISAFYWPDRYTTQEIHDCHYVHPLLHVFSALHFLHLHYGPVIMLTSWGPVPEPKQYSLKITRHITLARAPINSPVAEAGEKADHNTNIHKCEFIATVRYPDNSISDDVFSFEIGGADMVIYK